MQSWLDKSCHFRLALVFPGLVIGLPYSPRVSVWHGTREGEEPGTLHSWHWLEKKNYEDLLNHGVLAFIISLYNLFFAAGMYALDGLPCSGEPWSLHEVTHSLEL